MKVELTKREAKGFAFYETTLFGQKIGLSKKLVDHLKEHGLLKKTVEVGPEWYLFASITTKGEKTYTNYYFTFKSKDATKASADGDEIPF